MINLNKEETLKHKLYNLCRYIHFMNMINFLLYFYHFILSLQNNNLQNIYFNALNLFVIIPLIYYGIKYYVMFLVIITQIYKIGFIIYKLVYFYYGYNLIDVIIVQINIYILYFNFKYMYFNFYASKNMIYELCNEWKPEYNILILY